MHVAIGENVYPILCDYDFEIADHGDRSRDTRLEEVPEIIDVRLMLITCYTVRAPELNESRVLH